MSRHNIIRGFLVVIDHSQEAAEDTFIDHAGHYKRMHIAGIDDATEEAIKASIDAMPTEYRRALHARPGVEVEPGKLFPMAANTWWRLRDYAWRDADHEVQSLALDNVT